MNVVNQIEMGLGLATIPFDAAAQYYDSTDSKKTAALLHLTTDAISILNKLFFFYNNSQASYVGSDVLTHKRDTVVNALWFVRDITRGIQHWKTYKKAQDVVVAEPENDVVVDGSDDQFLSFNEKLNNGLKAEEISRLAYACQVLVLPVLRGLSASLLAWSQVDTVVGEISNDNIQNLVRIKDQKARFLASSFHSLVRLSEEYTELEAGSAYKKLLAGALIANTLWLVKEINDEFHARQRFVSAQRDERNLRRALEQQREQLIRELEQAQRDGQLGAELQVLLQRLQQGNLSQQELHQIHVEILQLRLQVPAQQPGLQPWQVQEQQRQLQELAEIMQNIRRLRGEDAEVNPPAPGQEEQQRRALAGAQQNLLQQLQRQPVMQLRREGVRNCAICTFRDGDMRQLGCGHAYCMECLGEYVGHQINDERVAHILCPDRDCQHQVNGVDGRQVNVRRHIPDGEIRAIIQANNLNAEEERYNRLRMVGMPGTRIGQGCQHVFANPNGLRIVDFTCPEPGCNQQYCSNCGVAHARNISCMRARIAADPTTRAWLDASENRTLCPGCFTRCERANACPNMVCSEARCRRQFCLYCHGAPGQHQRGCRNRWFDNTPDAQRARGI